MQKGGTPEGQKVRDSFPDVSEGGQALGHELLQAEVVASYEEEKHRAGHFMWESNRDPSVSTVTASYRQERLM